MKAQGDYFFMASRIPSGFKWLAEKKLQKIREESVDTRDVNPFAHPPPLPP